jgi:hypothetical protein
MHSMALNFTFEGYLEAVEFLCINRSELSPAVAFNFSYIIGSCTITLIPMHIPWRISSDLKIAMIDVHQRNEISVKRISTLLNIDNKLIQPLKSFPKRHQQHPLSSFLYSPQKSNKPINSPKLNQISTNSAHPVHPEWHWRKGGILPNLTTETPRVSNNCKVDAHKYRHSVHTNRHISPSPALLNQWSGARKCTVITTTFCHGMNP